MERIGVRDTKQLAEGESLAAASYTYEDDIRATIWKLKAEETLRDVPTTMMERVKLTVDGVVVNPEVEWQLVADSVIEVG